MTEEGKNGRGEIREQLSWIGEDGVEVYHKGEADVAELRRKIECT